MPRNNQSILLVGAGPMAAEYAKVLKTLGQKFLVLGRGKESAKHLSKEINQEVLTGGVDQFFKKHSTYPQQAIVTVSEEQLGIVARKLLQQGIKIVLVEKPAGLDFKDIKKLCKLSEKLEAEVYIGYNRRFYASVERAKQIIETDGGISSIFFDFTEASFRIAPLAKGYGVKENWFLQNSTHVIDLAFFLAGCPKRFHAFTGGSLPWHSRGAIFAGVGITTKGILFAYHANWDAPGRWSIEIMTKNNKLILKPLEKLQIQTLGTFEVGEVKLDGSADTKFKPGIYKQVQSFLGNKGDLCTIHEQVENLKFYKRILEGDNTKLRSNPHLP